MWCKPHKPDTSFDENGDFSVCIHVHEDSEEFTYLADIIDKAAAEWFAIAQAKEGKKRLKKANLPGHKEVLDDDEQPTGFREFRFKKPAWVKSDKPAQGINVFDAGGKPTHIDVGNGSTGKVAFSIKGYYSSSLGCGLSLYPRGIQVLKHVPFGGGASFDDMFEKEDGFEAAGEDEAAGNAFPEDPPSNGGPASGGSF